MKWAKAMEIKTALCTYPIKRNSFSRTCKPTGDPLLKVEVCLTENGNRKSLPLFQFIIVECGSDEFCESADNDEDAFGYIFLVFNPLLQL